MSTTASKPSADRHIRPGFVRGALSLAAMVLALGVALPATAQESVRQTGPEPAVSASKSSQKIVGQGIAVEFSVEPTVGSTVMEGKDATVRFKVSDTSTNTPVTGLSLSAWMKRRQTDKATDVAQCKEMIKSFLQGSLRARPDVDLNSYYILVLNDEANISVIDPLIGFGGSKLLTLVMLKSPGSAWVMSNDQRRLFVAMPLIGEVAVVDTATWKVVTNIPVETGASNITLQPDGKYLWVTGQGSDGSPGGIAAIDSVTMQAAGKFSSISGSDQMAFTTDSRFALVGNRSTGTVSVIDVGGMKRVADLKTGADVADFQFSPLSKAFYSLSEKDGSATVIDSSRRVAVAKIEFKPGSSSLRFAPGGRYGFVTNPKENTVTIFDASTNRVIKNVVVGKSPDQIVFSNAFAYVRSADSEEVHLIRLSTVENELDITMFPGGQLAPGEANDGEMIAPAPDGATMLVANSADKMIYYYTEGMAAPMGNFQNYGRVPKAVKIADRSLRETKPGVYTTTVRLPDSGEYDVAFLADSPRLTHCFEAESKADPFKKAAQSTASLDLQHLIDDHSLVVNKSSKLRFRLSETTTKKPKEDLKDVRVLTFLAPGVWQVREIARSIGDGVYEVEMNVPEPGVYMVFIEVPSLGIGFRQLPSLTLHASGDSVQAAGDQSKPNQQK